MSFLPQVKRRRVVRVAIVYGAVAFAVLQAADLIVPRVQLPDWTVTLVLVLTLLGFPIALVLAWALEGTPEGIRKTTSASGAAPGELPSLFGRRAVAVAFGLVVLGMDGDQEWFSDGLTEEILNSLARWARCA